MLAYVWRGTRDTETGAANKDAILNVDVKGLHLQLSNGVHLAIAL